MTERARGETARFLALLNVYKDAPQVTRDRMYLDTMQNVFSSTSKVLVDAEGGNNMMYLPLDQLTRTRNKTSGSSGSSDGASSDSGADIQQLTDQVVQEIRMRNNNSSSRKGR